MHRLYPQHRSAVLYSSIPKDSWSSLMFPKETNTDYETDLSPDLRIIYGPKFDLDRGFLRQGPATILFSEARRDLNGRCG